MSDRTQEKTQAAPQLSCELCRDRKVKCDKLEPCTNCLAAGVHCVPVHRLRLPRGRHANRPRRALPSPRPSQVDYEPRAFAENNEELRERIRRLETLVQSMSSARSTLPIPIPSSTVMADYREQEGPDEFWEDLVQEVEQLRDIVELSPGEADSEIVQAPVPEFAHIDVSDGELALLGLSSDLSAPDDWHWVSGQASLYRNKQSASQLCEVYLRQVDPIIKILHRPTLSKWMIHGHSYLRYPNGHPSTDALGAAVCYSAVNSMTEIQCRAMFNRSKSSVLPDCRKACECAIEKSGLLTTQDVTVLQSFVLYLVARGSDARNRAVWTLVATAVRTAKASRLHSELPRATNTAFFDQQMRERLWLTICVLDMQTAMAQASKPLIGVQEVAQSIPQIKNINDSDFELETADDIPDRDGLTDITFALVKFHLQVMGRQVGDGRGSSSLSHGTYVDWETKQKYTQQFERNVLPLLHFCDPRDSPYAWFTWHSTQLFVAGARLAALRPLYRAKTSVQNIPPRLRDETELLQQTTRALEKMELMFTDPRAEDFRWMVTIQWHILAIAIAECYVCTNQDLVRSTWAIIESLYRRHESIIMRNTGGSLQGPLGKLMRRTREKMAVTLHSCSPTLISADTRSIQSKEIGSTLKNTRTHPVPLHREPTLSTLIDVPPTDENECDQSWKMWEEFMCDMSFDELNSHSAFP